jgi:glycosyltransferase involved in cell wall biosynthesis
MRKFKLSIIIPVYGVEKFILNFVESLFPQLTDEVECIFINDGCLDDSIKILEKEVLQNNNVENITIINQKNSGIGSARNAGLRIAQGEFIGFLDPDDMVKPNYIISLLDVIKNTTYNIDIIHINAEVLDLKNETHPMCITKETGLIKVNKDFLICHFSKHMWQPWLRIFNHQILKDFSFPTECILEDLMSFPFLYKQDMNIYEINEPLVIYRLSEGSATAKKNELFFRSFRKATLIYKKFLDKDYYKVVYFGVIDELFMLKLKCNNFNEYRNFVEEYKDDIEYIRKNLCPETFKSNFRYSYPILFYIYKTRFFLKKFYK